MYFPEITTTESIFFLEFFKKLVCLLKIVDQVKYFVKITLPE